MKNKNLCGKRIKLVRINRDMKQIELCAALEVDHNIEMGQATLSNIERGERIVQDTELAAFAVVLEVSPIWLLFGDNAPKFNDKPIKS